MVDNVFADSSVYAYDAQETAVVKIAWPSLEEELFDLQMTPG